MKNRLVIILVLTALLLGGLSFPRPAHAGAAFCHTVQRGETLAQIANFYGVTVSQIAAANNISNPNLIYVGQCLIIPAQQFTPSGCTTNYVVKPGDYLKLIAAKFGTTWQAIANANGLTNPNLIFVGQHLIIPVKCQPQPKPQPKPQPAPKPGPWTAQYWSNAFLSGNPHFSTTVSTVDFNFGTKGPGHGVPGTDFSARYTTNMSLNDGTYRFHILVDDGVRFWVDDVLLIDQWHETAVVEYTVDKDISTGNHKLQIDYFQHLGVARIKFFAEKIGAPAWTAEFFNNPNLQGNPVLTRSDSAINFDWSNNAPAPGITADYFSVRWTGQFPFVGGKYRFTAVVDDGMRIWVDNNLIIDQWHLTSVTTYTADVDISAGNHSVKVEYFENNGFAVAKVSWVQK